MKKHLSILASIVLLLASSILFAQSDSNAVKKLAQSLRSHKSLEVSFTYQTVGDDTKPEEAKKGMAYFQDNAYKFIMEDQHVISNGQTKWHYIVEDEEVMVGNATDDDNPYKILDKLERDSSSLNPVIDKKGNLKSLEVEIDEGIKLILNIEEMSYDHEYDDHFFSFDEKAYPNVDIIDMR
ncbi:MAG: outer membrane lipoprotein carrier protein LolA [Bacteroidales bacterium]|nr:outer membrane lipoprotein carrier protein LolA [Bacteroidales bacterium]